MSQATPARSLETLTAAFESVRTNPVLLGVFVGVWGLTFIGGFTPYWHSVFGYVLVVLGGAVAVVVADAERHRRSVSLLEASRRVLSNILTLLGVLLAWTVSTGLGLLLFVVPGIYVGTRLGLAFPACVLENSSVIASLRRSWQLTSGRVGTLLGIVSLLALPLVAIAVMAFVGLVTIGVEGIINFPLPWNVLGVLLSIGLVAIVTATVSVALTRVYLETTEHLGVDMSN